MKWNPHSEGNDEYAMKREGVFNLIGNKFGRNHLLQGMALPKINALAKYIVVSKREIWDKISQKAKRLNSLPLPDYQALDSSQEAGQDFCNAVSFLRLENEAEFVSEFAKAVITPETLAECLSDPKSGFVQLLANKLIQEEGAALFPDNRDEVAALRRRIASGEEVRFTEKQLKTINFRGLKRYGLIQ